MESVDHIFSRCLFFQRIWEELEKSFQFHNYWVSNSLEDNLRKWCRIQRNLYILHLFTIWEVWRERNNLMFHDFHSNVVHVSSKVSSSFFECTRNKAKNDRRKVPFPFQDTFHIVGFFNGAEQEGLYGVGIVVRFNSKHVVNLWMGASKGTNTKVLVLWGLLWFSKHFFYHLVDRWRLKNNY